MRIDPTVGGEYALIMPGGVIMTGHFLHLEPERSFSHTWQWQGDDEQTRVHVALTGEGEGEGEGKGKGKAHASWVEITHSGFQSETSYHNHAAGWDSFIQGFAGYLDQKQNKSAE